MTSSAPTATEMQAAGTTTTTKASKHQEIPVGKPMKVSSQNNMYKAYCATTFVICIAANSMEKS
ncbi:hypothetical protein CHS0354_040879 [Potamilus streckersoni]|uniref:Uncharacterized protein n=1 Tax=Potamilus streckersoni TaxID=2493646 RepID=A0AAE0SLV8_9BIVA|nr:hypothetical protein CHS0354_040879 [Potamilus streckersoni]